MKLAGQWSGPTFAALGGRLRKPVKIEHIQGFAPKVLIDTGRAI
jgi:hypothetical protein